MGNNNFYDVGGVFYLEIVTFYYVIMPSTIDLYISQNVSLKYSIKYRFQPLQFLNPPEIIVKV